MTLYIRVIPNARRTRFTGWRDGGLVLKVAAPARKGQANRATAIFLSKAFGISQASVCLIAGEKSRHKKFEIIGLDAGRLERTVAGLLRES